MGGTTARWPAWSRAAVVLVVLLVVAEAAARAIEPSLPPAPGWPNIEIARKYERIGDLAGDGGVELLVLGSSVADAGLDPDLLPPELTGERGAYNAALLSASLQVSSTWAGEVVDPELDPGTVVIGVSSGDLVHREPQLDAWFYGAAEVRRLLGDESAADRLERWLDERSTLVRTRAQLRDPEVVLDAIGDGAPPSGVSDAGLNTTLYGHAIDVRPEVLAGIRAVLTGYSIDPAQLDVLGGLVADLEASGARVIVVTMPYAEAYIGCHPRGQADIDAFVAAVGSAVTDVGGEVVSFGVYPDDLMADPVHVNRAGSTRLTGELAAYLRPTAPQG